MSFSRDVFVALLGGALILAVLLGLFIIESREGAREHEIEPVEHRVMVEGNYGTSPAQGTMGPQGTCIPDFPMTECEPARTRLDLRVEGLPMLDDDGYYGVFLMGGDEGPLLLGALDGDDGAHGLVFDEERDTGSYEDLIIVLEDEADASTPGALWLYQRTIGPGPETTVDLSDETQMGLRRGGGQVRTSQTGAVTVSALVDAQLTGFPALSGWALHAWFVDEDRDPVVYTYLDELKLDPDDERATLDVRRERVRIEDQDRFLVTLEPQGEPGPGPSGFPAYQAVLRST